VHEEKGRGSSALDSGPITASMRWRWGKLKSF